MRQNAALCGDRLMKLFSCRNCYRDCTVVLQALQLFDKSHLKYSMELIVLEVKNSKMIWIYVLIQVLCIFFRKEPDNKILGLPISKAFADDKLNVTENIKVVFHRI